MQRNDYTEALDQLTPEQIITSLSNYSDAQIDAQVDRVMRFRLMNPKIKKPIINGVIVLLLMTHNGKLPNDQYIKKTLQSFINEHKLESSEDILDFIIRRKEYLAKKKDEKKANRKSYYDNVINPDVSDVMNPTPEAVQKSKQMLEQLHQSKQE